MSGIEDADLAKKIKRLRSKLNLTQEQFAAKVGVTFSTVNRWEGGKSTPSPLAMRQIEELLTQITDAENGHKE
ncbi:MAG: helix-turn-helix transcriptional regulator [Desulfobacteraceae bacterium]|nr:helix-turn-helix transcriptional regulator [Desulfobacteraceae bacterium]MBC2756297.1 helix-turn-helix transcriptional regulator [Desulfobacteraceae bacterium]